MGQLHRESSILRRTCGGTMGPGNKSRGDEVYGAQGVELSGAWYWRPASRTNGRDDKLFGVFRQNRRRRREPSLSPTQVSVGLKDERDAGRRVWGRA